MRKPTATNFRVSLLSVSFLILDAARLSVSKALISMASRRVSWIVLRFGGSYFVLTSKEVRIAIRKAKAGAVLSRVLSLEKRDPSNVVKSLGAKVSLDQPPTYRTTSSKVVVLSQRQGSDQTVSAIGSLQKIDPPSKSVARKRTPASRMPIHDGVAASLIPSPVKKEISAATQLFKVVDIFYATDREPVSLASKTSAVLKYSNSLATKQELDYGVCSVTIPTNHKLGKIESPSIWSFEIKANPEKHITLASCSTRSASLFFKELRSQVAAHDSSSCFVFIHGYNTSFEDAAKRTAQLACDLNFLGTPVLYSWASASDWRKYSKDTETVHLTVDRLTGFLRSIAGTSGATKIHLIAHSMGNRALLEALRKMRTSRSKKPFNQIVFTAPDVPRVQVEPLIQAATSQAERVTLYASEKDKALGLSNVKNDYERLGKVYRYPFIFPGMDSIDASKVETDFWAHAVFAQTRSVLGDLAALILDGHPPDRRFGLRPVDSSNGRCWQVTP